jgi:flavin-dependent dehydrogenase
MYDAIVIGARCAGAATAMLLARKGHSVLLVDRATFPSEIPHGHFVHRHGPRRLADWGVLDEVLATGCPAVTSTITDLGDFPLEGTGIEADGVPLGLGPRRAQLDKVLIDAAVAAGAELREGFAVDDYLTADGAIGGVVGRGGDRERARIVVGADGRNSGLARRVAAPVAEQSPTLTCWYWSYWTGAPARGLELYLRERRVIFAFPTHAGMLAVFVGAPIGELAAARADIEAHVLATVDAVPDLSERVRAGERAERLLGAAQLPNFVRKPYGPGWALVGDAGCHKDPFLALGICDALRDAELLADALDEGLSGRAPMDSALAGYERARNDATLPEFHNNVEMARLAPRPGPPEQYALRAALRGNAEDTRGFYLAIQGMADPAPFFDPANLRRIFAAAAA